jgi:hypothetical protein
MSVVSINLVQALMSYYLVDIAGDPARAAGLLAVQGVQSIPRGGSEGVPPDGMSARVSAQSPEDAVSRVRRALQGEPFTLGEPHPD